MVRNHKAKSQKLKKKKLIMLSITGLICRKGLQRRCISRININQLHFSLLCHWSQNKKTWVLGDSNSHDPGEGLKQIVALICNTPLLFLPALKPVKWMPCEGVVKAVMGHGGMKSFSTAAPNGYEMWSARCLRHISSHPREWGEFKHYGEWCDGT